MSSTQENIHGISINLDIIDEDAIISLHSPSEGIEIRQTAKEWIDTILDRMDTSVKISNAFHILDKAWKQLVSCISPDVSKKRIRAVKDAISMLKETTKD
jgi:predicted RNA-binding protein Jag